MLEKTQSEAKEAAPAAEEATEAPAAEEAKDESSSTE